MADPEVKAAAARIVAMFEKKAEDGFYFMKYDHEPQYTELCVDGTFLLSEIEEAIRG